MSLYIIGDSDSVKVPGAIPGVQFRIVDYNSHASLVQALEGSHTVLSFTQVLSDADQTAQKNLIDAAVAAKVARFAPSEYGR